VSAGNCSLVGSYRMVAYDGSFVFQTVGLSGTMSSAVNGQVQPTSINVTITTSHVVERIKNSTDSIPNCNVPTGLDTSPYDTRDHGGSPVATGIQFIELEEYDCYGYSASRVSGGVKIDGIYFILTNSTQPDFKYHIAFEVSNGTHYEFPNNDTTHTNGVIYSYKWLAERVKITVKVIDFPWLGTPGLPGSQSSFLSLHFRMKVDVVPCTFSYCDAFSTSVVINSTNLPRQQLVGEWEKYFITDGVPRYVSDRNSPCVTGDFIGYFPATWVIGIPICDNTIAHYREMIYDPTLASTFALDATNPETNPNSPLAKSNKTTVIVASSVASIVFVAIIVFVMLFIFVEPIRNTIMPSTVSVSSAMSKGTTKPKSKPFPSSSTSTNTRSYTSSAATAPIAKEPVEPQTATKSAAWTTASKPPQ